MTPSRVAAYAAVLGAAAVPIHASAQDYVAVWGNYYKERSTRVISPMVRVQKELPEKIRLRATYLVDQITSASGAFTSTDEPFSEFRHDIELVGSIELARKIRPELRLRFSTESDYTSYGIGASVSIPLFDDMSTLSLAGELQLDGIGQRDRPAFQDNLTVVYFAARWSQIFRPDLLGGFALSTRVSRGFQENPYRVEQHPRDREEISAAVFGRYHYPPSRTTFRLEYCFHTGSWESVGHTLDFRVTQRVLRWLQVEPRVVFHTQDPVFFDELSEIPNPDNPDGPPLQLITADPKLMDIHTWYAGLKLMITVESLRGLQIHPMYAYYWQDNRYEGAHIAQLGFYLPF